MLNTKGLKAFFTTKNDGNIAYHVVDKKEYSLVDENRVKLSSSYGIKINNLKYMEQVHGNNVQIVDGKINLYKNCDALITDKIDTPLMVMSADCIGILFYDSVKRVIAVAHAGRNGTFLNISKKLIFLLTENFNSKPEDIQIVLGPSIQKCCYEVSDEMSEIVIKNFGEEFANGRFIDLQGINKKQLLDMGIKEKNIEISKVCTKCGGKEYFSYRNDKSCGRFAGVISLV